MQRNKSTATVDLSLSGETGPMYALVFRPTCLFIKRSFLPGFARPIVFEDLGLSSTADLVTRPTQGNGIPMRQTDHATMYCPQRRTCIDPPDRSGGSTALRLPLRSDGNGGAGTDDELLNASEFWMRGCLNARLLVAGIAGCSDVILIF